MLDQKIRQEIAEVFQRNIDNKITPELANGILQLLFNIIENKIQSSSQEMGEKQ